jgi:hypothetical protein
MKMSREKSRFGSLPIAAALVLGALSLSACATKDYVDEQIAAVNGHINAVDAKATEAGQKADAAAAAAQAAQSTASTAEAAATQANQRLDALTPRVDALEQHVAKKRARN